MEFTFLNIVVIYVLVLMTYVSKVVTNKVTVSTYMPIIESHIGDALQYTRNITGNHPNAIEFSKLGDKEQNLFVGHAIGYMRLNYGDMLKELNIDNDEKICSMIVSRIK